MWIIVTLIKEEVPTGSESRLITLSINKIESIYQAGDHTKIMMESGTIWRSEDKVIEILDAIFKTMNPIT